MFRIKLHHNGAWMYCVSESDGDISWSYDSTLALEVSCDEAMRIATEHGGVVDSLLVLPWKGGFR